MGCQDKRGEKERDCSGDCSAFRVPAKNTIDILPRTDGFCFFASSADNFQKVKKPWLDQCARRGHHAWPGQCDLFEFCHLPFVQEPRSRENIVNMQVPVTITLGFSFGSFISFSHHLTLKVLCRAGKPHNCCPRQTAGVSHQTATLCK